MPPVVQIQLARAPGDCCVVALSMYLGCLYEDVLAAAVKSTASPRIHHRGMFTREIKSTAKRLGATLRLRRGFDLDEDEGILILMGVKDRLDQHAVLLKNAMVFDGDGTVTEHDSYTTERQYRPVSLLVKEGD